MSGGSAALSGFTYQKDYAALRILSSEALRLLDVGNISECIDSFVIEGPAIDGSTAWDFVWRTGNNFDLRECKDTEITKDDRRTFYRRVRRAVAVGINPDQLTIGWVTDPFKQGRILDHWQAIRNVSSPETGSTQLAAPEEVTSAATALAEGLYYLSFEAACIAGSPPVPLHEAKALLDRIDIARFRAEHLGSAVSSLATSLFEQGLGDTIRTLIQGMFDTVIQARRQAAYTREQFLTALAGARLTMGLAGEFREILQFQKITRESTRISGIVWTRLPQSPQKIWDLVERIGDIGSSQSGVLVAPTGEGKTTCSHQALRQQLDSRPHHHVLYFDAGSVTPEIVRAIPLLCLMLCGISPTWVAIDGLDQITDTNFLVWKQAFQRLHSIPQLTLFLSVRAEVVDNYAWMQQLAATLGEIALPPLSQSQIAVAFQEVGLPAPRNPSLISCLQNAFLFSVYASTVTLDDMPLAESGEIAAFNVIDEFWKRRVITASDGARGSGDPSSSHVAKRAAVRYLAQCTLDGQDVIGATGDDAYVAQGIQMLCNEGVLQRHTTNSVKWRHSWFREYAIVDHLCGQLPSVTPFTLAQSVCRIDTTHVARDAANGGCKWLIARPTMGQVGDYVQTLYGQRKELAREVLFDLMDGSNRHLSLATLSPTILIEAIELANQKHAHQWSEQIAGLPDHLFATELGSELARLVTTFETMVGSDA